MPNKIKVPRFNEKSGFTTTPERSKHMSKIRGKKTKPEVLFAKKLWSLGIRYRKNVKKLPGNPDIVISSRKIVIFVDGEFWHGYKWEEKKLKIKANRAFWIPKIERNMQRDSENNIKLIELGYTVLRFWGNEIIKNLDSCVKQVMEINT